jgi:hypothetical protein
MADNCIMEESPLNRNTPGGVKGMDVRRVAYKLFGGDEVAYEAMRSGTM